MSSETQNVTPLPKRRPGLLGVIERELRSRPFGYGVLVVFVIAGPVVTRLLFPEAPLSAGIVGGLAFGLYAALCAVPQKFL